MTFAETVKKLRRAKRLTQKQLAEKMGISAPAVTQWEGGGGIEAPNLKKLAKALEVPLRVLADALESDAPSQESDQQVKNLPDSNTPKGNNTHASSTHQEGSMPDEGLRDSVLKDILNRLNRIENQLSEREPAESKPDPRKRRKV